MVNGEQGLPQRLAERFQAALVVPAATEPHLARALEAATTRTGNFIRAQLAWAVAVALGAEDPAATDLAIALEYFHTASLIFDDLPSMDDAESRRGVPCLHREYGEGTAILAALALINRAYALLWQAAGELTAADRRAALTYVERYLGLEGLLQGQSLDLRYAAMDPRDRSPHAVARGKTVSLMRLSLVLPAQLHGASADVLRDLDHLAVFWGLAYQAIDDLKDVLHGAEQAGKSTARDRALDRPNIVLHRGFDAALHALEKQVRYGERTLSRLIERDPRLGCLRSGGDRLARELSAIRVQAVANAA